MRLSVDNDIWIRIYVNVMDDIRHDDTFSDRYWNVDRLLAYEQEFEIRGFKIHRVDSRQWDYVDIAVDDQVELMLKWS